MVFSPSIDVVDVDASDGFVGSSDGFVGSSDASDGFVGVSGAEVDDEVKSMGISDISGVDVEVASSFLEVEVEASVELTEGSSVLEIIVVEVIVDASPIPVVEVNSPATIDCVTPSEVAEELEVISLGNVVVEVDSDSDFSVVDSKTFVVDGVVGGRVMSGGQGLSLVVFPIVGRVGRIDESDDEVSELDEVSVDVDGVFSDDVSIVLETVEGETSSVMVELILLESCVVFVSISVVKVDDEDSVEALLRSRTSIVVVEKGPSKDVVGTDCVIVVDV